MQFALFRWRPGSCTRVPPRVPEEAEQTGVLVLSEFTGAAEELHEALPCNPFDVDGLASTIELALELDEQDRRQRHRAHGDDRPRARRVRMGAAGDLHPRAGPAAPLWGA